MRLWASFLVIIVITVVVNDQLFENYRLWFHMNQLLKYGLNVLSLAVLTGVGYWGWCADERKWLRSLWLVLYLLFTVIFLGYGITDKYIYHMSAQVKADFRFYRNVLFSPVPFMLLFILSIVFRNDDAGKRGE